MPRSNRPRRRGKRAATGGDDGPDDSRAGAGVGAGPGPAIRTVEQHPDGAWTVQQLTGLASTKTYRCPGCNQEVRAGVPHLVVWAADGPLAGLGGVDERRHWHTPCWRARGRRGR